MKRVSTRKRNAIVAAHRGGATPAELQKRYGVSASSIHRWAKAVANPPKRKPGKTSPTPADGISDGGAIEDFVDSIVEDLRGLLTDRIRDGVRLGVADHIDRIVVALRARVTEVA